LEYCRSILETLSQLHGTGQDSGIKLKFFGMLQVNSGDPVPVAGYRPGFRNNYNFFGMLQFNSGDPVTVAQYRPEFRNNK
jgi:hypothetical protein